MKNVIMKSTEGVKKKKVSTIHSSTTPLLQGNLWTVQYSSQTYLKNTFA